MGIKIIQACEVSCQKCPATIVVLDWRDAGKWGWAVPCDGGLQLCPCCLARHTEAVFAAIDAERAAGLTVVDLVTEKKAKSDEPLTGRTT